MESRVCTGYIYTLGGFRPLGVRVLLCFAVASFAAPMRKFGRSCIGMRFRRLAQRDTFLLCLVIILIFFCSSYST